MDFLYKGLSLEQQYQLLLERKLDMGSMAKEDVLHFLKHVSFFHFQRYFYHFLKRSENSYIFLPGTSFLQLVTIYQQDKQDQSKFLASITTIEASFVATIISLTVEERGPHWIYDRTYYNTHSIFREWLVGFQKNIDLYRKKHHIIELYYQKGYTNPPYPPLQNVIEILSLGQLSKLIKSLRDKMKKKIAKVYGLPPGVFLSRIEGLTEVRNISAHNDVLYRYDKLKQLMRFSELSLSPEGNNLDDYRNIIAFLTDKISVKKTFNKEGFSGSFH